MRFQVGDKVKVLSFANGSASFVGEVGTIIKIINGFEWPLKVKLDTKRFDPTYEKGICFSEKELEHYFTLTEKELIAGYNIL